MPDAPTISGRAFQQTPPQPFPTLHAHRTPAWRNAIARPRPTVEHQRIERPVRIGVHLDSAIPADQNGHFLAALPAIERFQGGIHQILGLFGEPVHPLLIAIPDRGFTLFEN
jgi:hypothetical protein